MATLIILLLPIDHGSDISFSPQLDPGLLVIAISYYEGEGVCKCEYTLIAISSGAGRAPVHVAKMSYRNFAKVEHEKLELCKGKQPHNHVEHNC